MLAHVFRTPTEREGPLARVRRPSPQPVSAADPLPGTDAGRTTGPPTPGRSR
jgi:hypothetical protein